jgi:hypothetical protein
MTYQTEFPQYDDVLTFPEGWEDTSYRHDVAPSFSKDLGNGQRLMIFCDYKTLELREFHNSPDFKEYTNQPRFGLSVWEDEDFVELLCQSDTFEEILSKANKVMS